MVRVWNGFLANSDYYRAQMPRGQDLYDRQFVPASLVYRFNAAGRHSTYSFRDFLEEVNSRGLVNFGEWMAKIVIGLPQNGEWIGPEESLDAYVIRHKNTPRTVELASFLGDNTLMEILLRFVLQRTWSSHMWEFMHDDLSLEIDGLLYNEPHLLLSREYARRDFDWWGS